MMRGSGTPTDERKAAVVQRIGVNAAQEIPARLLRRTKMTEIDARKTVDELTLEQWLQMRKEEGRKIDPETAEVWFTWAQTLDPYGVYPDLPEECQQVGRAYFARSPGSDIPVSFYDLPDETRRRLWEQHESILAFPAGLEWFAL